MRHEDASWERRFRELVEDRPVQVLWRTDDQPSWLEEREDYSIWSRVNLWMLHAAAAVADAFTLIALWNGAGGDGPGGTEDMVGRASEAAASRMVLDTVELFGLDEPA